jgi:small subunit ribosomal protein S21
MEVLVRDNDVTQALRSLERNMQCEGTRREMKRRTSYERPSERREPGSRARRCAGIVRRRTSE